MYDDYYNQSPRQPLPRPLILTGRFHSDTRRVAHYLAGQLGHPLQDIDDIASHTIGSSIVALRKQAGPRVHLSIQADALKRVLEQKPPAIIRVGEEVLNHLPTRRLVTPRATVIYIKRAATFEGAVAENNPPLVTRFMQAFIGLVQADASDAATHIIDGGDRHALKVALQIVELVSGSMTQGAPV